VEVAGGGVVTGGNVVATGSAIPAAVVTAAAPAPVTAPRFPHMPHGLTVQVTKQKGLYDNLMR